MYRREQRTRIDSVDFGRVFQFQMILGAIAGSLQPARLIIGLGMVIVLVSSGRLWDAMAGTDASTLNQTITQEQLQQRRAIAIAESATALGGVAPDDSQLWSVQDAQAYLVQAWKDYVFEGEVSKADLADFERLYLTLEEVRPRGPFEATASYVTNAWTTVVDSGLDGHPIEIWNGIVSIVWDLPQKLWQGGYHWFISLFGFLLVYVLCLGGGAIARMQACGHSRALRPSVRDALDFSISNWRPLLTSVFGPAMFTAAITIMLMVFGLVLLNVPYLNLLGGVFYGIALLMGFLVAVIAVGYIACFPMLIPGVVVEHCSGGEAIQRSYAYLLSRSLHLAGYLIVLVISLLLGFLLVQLIATMTVDLTASLVGAWLFNGSVQVADAMRDSTIPLTGIPAYESMAGGLIHYWESIVHYLVIGWLFSGFFSSSTMLYLLMRNACDGQDTKDIWWEGLIQGTNVPSG